MMMESNIAGTGADGAPISADNYKRAVYRAPPARFYVEMLLPVKQGGSHSYGMRISAINPDGSSISSKDSHSEYEVWRRWEDCLWFQEVIELEYARTARSKRARLVKGRGVKKNGMYIHDQAASFESLPPGPDPNSIAQDIHNYIPKLTKKGTVFRASQATIDQRFRELKDLIDGLFRDDAPTLLRELREQRLVTDFFGFWRRDHDLALKNKRAASKQPRNSVSSSVFAGYFSASSPSLANSGLPPPRPSHPPSTLRVPRPQPRPLSVDCLTPSPPSSNRESISSRSSSASDEDILRRPLSSGTVMVTTARASSASPYEPDSPVAIHQDIPIAFGHKPQHLSDYQGPSGLESLPEDRVLTGMASAKQTLPHLRTYRTSMSGRDNRNCQIFCPPPNDPSLPSSSANRPVRESWQTTTSISSYLESLDIQYRAPSEYSRRNSVATFMTNTSADAVIPMSESSSMRRSRRTSSSASSRRLKTSLSDGEYDDEMIDAFFYDPYSEPRSSSPQSVPDSRPVTALGRRLSMMSVSSKSSSDHLASFFRPESALSGLTSMSSIPPASPGGNSTVAIKAALNNSIVMLRVPCGTSFEDVRKRLYDKFVGQEGIPLSESFTVAYILPSVPTDPTPGKEHTRSGSISSVANSDPTQMQLVTSEKEWEEITILNYSTKLTLRILDAPV